MITDFFLMRRARQRREQRGRLADTLSQRLEREQTLTVSDSLISSMGVDRAGFFRAVYSMVMQERIHMMADAEGDVRLMTNAEFHRFMLRQSGARETEIRRREGVPALADTMEEHAIAAMEEETVVVDPVFAEMVDSSDSIDYVPFTEDDLGWFNLDVHPEPAAGNREKLPDTRQTIPDRRREPWPAIEETAVHFE